MPANRPPSHSPNDGTRQFLISGGSIVGAGVVAGVLLETLLGGYSRTGAHTNSGWFALIVVLACIPFGSMLLTLGIAKWLRNRRIARRG
ncbi:MAG: hypothetical protein WBE72_16585 [Terracidiphilus sp.]